MSTATPTPARKKPPLALIALGAALALLLVILAWQIFSPSKTPPPGALETAVAEALQARHGKLYTLAQFTPGPALNQAPALPDNDSPVTPAEPAPNGRIHYNATLTARLSEALYEPVNTPDYIANQLRLDTTAERKIDEILRTPAGPRIRELAGIDPNADTLANLRLVRETARAGTRVEFQALLDAQRGPSGWQINLAALTPKTPLPQGETLDKFTGRLLDITRDSDLATLRRLHAQSAETLRRVEAARDRHQAELAGIAARITNAALANLAPGTLYAGKATLPGQPVTPDICLEITNLDRATATLRAALRANSSWIAARPLEGRYACNPETGLFTLTLASPAGIPLASAGGITITDAKPIRITLTLNAADLSGDAGAWSCKLARVPDAARAATIATFGAAEQKLVNATRPGAIYRLRTGDSADLILRYQTQNPSTGALTATIEDPRTHWTRDLQGTLVTIAPRANDYPIRLLSTFDPAQTNAPAIGLTLRPENGNVFKGSIRMPDPRPVTAEPVTDDDLAELAAQARQKSAAEKDAIDMAALLETLPAPVRPAQPKPLDHIPAAEGAWIWDETAWNPLPPNNARVIRSTLQKVGGLWTSAVSLIKTRPEKQETGTLTFEGTAPPPSASGRDTLLVFRGELHTYAGTPEGKYPIEIAPLEIKNKGRKRMAELDRLGDAAATFGKKAEPLAIERDDANPNLYIIRPQRPLPAGRYALHMPGHSFEFEIRQ